MGITCKDFIIIWGIKSFGNRSLKMDEFSSQVGGDGMISLKKGGVRLICTLFPRTINIIKNIEKL